MIWYSAEVLRFPLPQFQRALSFQRASRQTRTRMISWENRQSTCFRWWNIQANYLRRTYTSDMRSTTSTCTSECTTSKSSTLSIGQYRKELIQNALKQVIVFGWTRRAIVEAAAALQQQQQQPVVSMSLSGLISEPEDLIFEQMKLWNEQLQNYLTAVMTAEEDNGVSPQSSLLSTPGQRAFHAIQTRLEYMQPFIESEKWAAAMAMGAHPLHAGTTALHLNKLLTIIGDFALLSTSANSSVYSPMMTTLHPAISLHAQSLSLGAIYVATELHLLTDTYPYTDTREFLQQRINEWEYVWFGTKHSASDYTDSSSNASTSFSPALSPSDALSVAWTVSTAIASGIQSVVLPQATANPFSEATTASPTASPSSNMMRHLIPPPLQPPSQLPTLPILGAPPAPLASLWSSMFDDDSTSSKPSLGTFNPSPSPPLPGTLPSHYDIPSGPHSQKTNVPVR